MKWFHHECAAKHDTKLEMLGKKFRAEGFGIFWLLLEEIGARSETFHLKVSGVSIEADQCFDNLRHNQEKDSACLLTGVADLNCIPRISVEALADVVFTTKKRLSEVIAECVKLELFDPSKWEKYTVLYSAGFERRADDYTRRLARNSASDRHSRKQSPDIVRPGPEESTDTVRALSANVPLEQHRQEQNRLEENRQGENRQEETETSGEERKEMLLNNNKTEMKLSELPARAEGSLNDPVALSETEFLRWSEQIRLIITTWNIGRSTKFVWIPQEGELRKLLFGGDAEHKRRQCYQAINIFGDGVTYPQIVCRAIELMLVASTRKRIENPFGWLWTALHGNGEGIAPWVTLPTAHEESVDPRLHNRALDKSVTHVRYRQSGS